MKDDQRLPPTASGMEIDGSVVLVRQPDIREALAHDGTDRGEIEVGRRLRRRHLDLRLHVQ